MTSERVIAPAKIGEELFGGKINADAVVKPLLVGRAVGVNDKIRLVANLHVETLVEEIEEEIPGFGESRPEIAKIDAHSLFHSRSVNGVKMGCQGRASLIPILPSREEIRIKNQKPPAKEASGRRQSIMACQGGGDWVWWRHVGDSEVYASRGGGDYA